MLGVAGVAALLAVLWWEHRTEITLPPPTGHFAVGRTTLAWVNAAQTDDLAASPGANREVLVWIWYPAAGSQSATTADYEPPPWRAALASSSGVLMSQFLTRDPALVHTHSSSDPGISSEQPSYPVVIMRAGGGALTTDFTTLAEDLASHGYVVVGFDAPHRTGVVVFPDGRVVARPPTANPENLRPADQERLINRLLPMWSGDATFVVDQLDRLNAADPAGRFTGRLDLRRLGIFGHSFGGATALQFCHDDARCKAGIDMDGAPHGSVVKESLTQPFLFLLSDHGDLADPGDREVAADIRSIYDRLPSGRLLVFIRGANHFSFSDQILLKSHLVVRLLQFFQGGLDGRRGLEITRAFVHTFFDVHLKNAPASLLDQLPRAYPEVQVVERLGYTYDSRQPHAAR
jgi:dienelactone hydrolase